MSVFVSFCEVRMNTSPTEKPELLTDRQVAAMYGCTPRSIWKWAAAGVLPRPVKIGGSTRWKRCEILEAISHLAAK